MYLGIDIGGTKTLVALLDAQGVIKERVKFPTAKDYTVWKQELAKIVANLSTKEVKACGVGVPGRLDRDHGVGLAMGNLPWRNVPIQKDVEKLLGCPAAIENDSKLAGLSEAMLVKQYDRVLYVTVGTGIGTGIITNQQINPALADAEGGKMLLEHGGGLKEWESFASGHAIREYFGKKACDITDDKSWKLIAHNLALGLIDLIAVIQPQIIIIGGGIGRYYDRFDTFLKQALDSHATPLVPIPPLKAAERPDDAVLYGCYDLAKATYGHTAS